MIDLNLSQVSQTKLESIDWGFITKFAKIWMLSICPLSNKPINMPCKLISIKPPKTQVVEPKLYDFFSAKMQLGKPSPVTGQVIVSLKPLNHKERRKLLDMFYEPMALALEHDCPIIFKKWLSETGLKDSLNYIQYPMFATTTKGKIQERSYVHLTLGECMLTYDCPKVLDYLIKLGLVDINYVFKAHAHKPTLLIKMLEAGYVGNVQVLLEHNASYEPFDVLLSAFKSGKPELIQLMVEKGACLPQTLSIEWEHAFNNAMESDKQSVKECCRLVIEHGLLKIPFNRGDHKKRSILDLAIVDYNFKQIVKIIELGFNEKDLIAYLDNIISSEQDKVSVGMVERAKSIQLLLKHPNVLLDLLGDNAEGFIRWSQSEEYDPTMPWPISTPYCTHAWITNQNGPVSNLRFDFNCIALDLLSFTYLNHLPNIRQHILRSFSKDQLRQLFDLSQAGPHQVTVLNLNAQDALECMELILKLYKDNPELRNQIIVEQLDLCLVTGAYDMFCDLVQALDASDIEELEPVSEVMRAKSVMLYDGVSASMFDMLRSPVIKACLHDWLESTYAINYLAALKSNNIDLLRFLFDQEGFDKFQTFSCEGYTQVSALGYQVDKVSAEVFAFLLSQGLNYMHKFEYHQDGESVKLTPLKEVFAYSRHDLIDLMLDNHELLGASGNYLTPAKDMDVDSFKYEDLQWLPNSEHPFIYYVYKYSKIEIFKKLIDKGLIRFDEPIYQLLYLTVALKLKQKAFVDILLSQFGGSIPTHFKIGDQTCPIMWMAVFTRTSDDILIDWMINKKFSVEDRTHLSGLLDLCPLEHLISYLMKPQVSNQRNNLLERSLSMVKTMLQHGQFEAATLQRCLIRLSAMPPTSEVNQAIDLLIDHIHRHNIEIIQSAKYKVKGAKPTKKQWASIVKRLNTKPSNPELVDTGNSEEFKLMNDALLESLSKASELEAMNSLKEHLVEKIYQSAESSDLSKDALRRTFEQRLAQLNASSAELIGENIASLMATPASVTTDEQGSRGIKEVSLPETQENVAMRLGQVDVKLKSLFAKLNTSQSKLEPAQLQKLQKQLNSLQQEFVANSEHYNGYFSTLGDSGSGVTSLTNELQAKLNAFDKSVVQMNKQLSKFTGALSNLLSENHRKAEIVKQQLREQQRLEKAQKLNEAKELERKQQAALKAKQQRKQEVSNKLLASHKSVMKRIESLESRIQSIQLSRSKVVTLKANCASLKLKIETSLSTLRDKINELEAIPVQVDYGFTKPIDKLDKEVTDTIEQAFDEEGLLHFKDSDDLKSLEAVNAVLSNVLYDIKTTARAVDLDYDGEQARLEADCSTVRSDIRASKDAMAETRLAFRKNFPHAKDNLTPIDKNQARNIELQVKELDAQIKAVSRSSNGLSVTQLTDNSQTLHVALHAMQGLEQEWTELFANLTQRLEANRIKQQDVEGLNLEGVPLLAGKKRPASPVVSLLSMQKSKDAVLEPVRALGQSFDKLAHQYNTSNDESVLIQLEIKANLMASIELDNFKGSDKLRNIRNCLAHYPFVYDEAYSEYIQQLVIKLSELKAYGPHFDPRFLECLPLPPKAKYCKPNSHWFAINHGDLFDHRMEQFLHISTAAMEDASIMEKYPKAISQALGELLEIAKRDKDRISREDIQHITQVRNAIMHARENHSLQGFALDDWLDLLPDVSKKVALK